MARAPANSVRHSGLLLGLPVPLGRLPAPVLPFVARASDPVPQPSPSSAPVDYAEVLAESAIAISDSIDALQEAAAAHLYGNLYADIISVAWVEAAMSLADTEAAPVSTATEAAATSSATEAAMTSTNTEAGVNDTSTTAELA